ncbi:primosomal protein N' family DNA-binding protein [Fretibacterium sp. OH1220_COT-178]|uniref:primosomal protein N' family DNA-binding protein n=1 Tax=Fretibacterium sp. OH1220_COT-178 TaxID=2491047 RepID=UPI0013155E2B|nr:hypothetical protein [Fretibacterium sp. OH1220_COT-178]
MPHLVDVVVPGPWWTSLTYGADRPLTVGARVRVPLGRGVRVGFVLGPAGQSELPRNLRSVAEVLDEKNVLGDDLWDLALWMGRTFLCGTGLALQALCPPPLLKGELLVVRNPLSSSAKGFRESSCFIPWDGRRADRYIQTMERGERTLVLFPERGMARTFFAGLPSHLQSKALLWPSTGGKKLWDAWRTVREGATPIVVGGPGAVFAPLRPDVIIVDDEANPGYIAQRPPRISARSLAGRRAGWLGAELVLGGRMPSSKTFSRTSPECMELPDRRHLVFVDMQRSLKADVRGIDGALPLTLSLLGRTRSTLEEGRNVLWILDRRGEAAEVFCSDCGTPVRCSRCGGTVRVEGKSKGLRCIRCGLRTSLERSCSVCRGSLWTGRRPGLEALATMAGRFIRGHPIILGEEGHHRGQKAVPSLILGTRGALTLCDSLDVGLAAWLDLDAELRKAEYGARFHAYSMVWESYWRGRSPSEERARIVLVQGRRLGGSTWRDTLMRGWGCFWREELSNRKALELPPFGFLVQIETPRGEDRAALVRSLEDARFFVMDPGEADLPLWVSTRSVESLGSFLAPRFGIERSRSGFPVVTVWAE